MRLNWKWLIYTLFLISVIFVFITNFNNNRKYRMKKFHKFVPYYGIMHVNCRNGYYPKTNNSVKREYVPDDLVNWDKTWSDYNPPTYTDRCIMGQPWADANLTDEKFRPKWNSIDNGVNRISYVCHYEIVNNFPLNPIGRTGLNGRGLLGRWGPNHAADPIVTKWKTDPINGEKVTGEDGKPIIQFVGIKRRDTGNWAIPGGMVDAGEDPTDTLKREFTEEALNFLQKNDMEKERYNSKIDRTFSNGRTIFQGYVDDHRNTDNAWIETVAVHFHDENGTDVATLPLTAGDDAGDVAWIDVNHELSLYASHATFFKKITDELNAYW